MSDYNRFANARSGAGVAQSATGAIDQGLRSYMLGVYNYMTLGLGVTGLVAFVAYKAAVVESATGQILGLTDFGAAIYTSILRYVVIFAPLAVVIGFSAGRNSLSVGAARGVFLLFAALIGLSMSTIFVVYTHGSIFRVFFETAAAFGALSLYGYTTKRDLSAMGSFMIMGLFGIIIASVVNIFLQSSGLQWALSIVAIGVFAGLTAWDTQRLKNDYIYGYASQGGDVAERAAITGALSLYLNFINLFTLLLQLLGQRD